MRKKRGIASGISKSDSRVLADLIKMNRELNHSAFWILADAGAGDCDRKRLEDWFSALEDALRPVIGHTSPALRIYS